MGWGRGVKKWSYKEVNDLIPPTPKAVIPTIAAFVIKKEERAEDKTPQ